VTDGNGNAQPAGVDLTAAQILSAMDRRLTRVNVPEWGGAVYLRTLSAAESLGIQEAIEQLPKEKYVERLCVTLGACLANSKGEPLFATEEDRKQLATRDQEVLVRLQKLANEHLGLEATEKNASGEAAAAASPTA
jgi:hypothetical protein